MSRAEWETAERDYDRLLHAEEIAELRSEHNSTYWDWREPTAAEEAAAEAR